MTKSEYHELIDFLGVRFDAIEVRLTRSEIGQESMREWFASQELHNMHVNVRLAAIEQQLSAA